MNREVTIPYEKCIASMREMEREKKYIFHLLRHFLANRHFNGIVVSLLCERFTITKTTADLLRRVIQVTPEGSAHVVVDTTSLASLKALLIGYETTRESLLVHNVSTELH